MCVCMGKWEVDRKDGESINEERQATIMIIYSTPACIISYYGIKPYYFYPTLVWSWDTSVSRVTSCRLDNLGSVSNHHIKIGCSEAHQDSFLMDTWVSFPGSKASEVWNWPPSSQVAPNLNGALLPLRLYAFVVWC
jgi:hypothetical protein